MAGVGNCEVVVEVGILPDQKVVLKPNSFAVQREVRVRESLQIEVEVEKLGP